MDGDESAGATAVEPTLTVAAVASRIGVAPATLRTWERRYGIGPSIHSAGSHRRYTPADLLRLENMRRLLLEGATAAEAARVARTLDVSDAEAGSTAEAVAEPAARRGGGNVLATPGGSAALRALTRSAQALEYGTCVEVIMRSLESRGAIWTWDHLLVPALAAVGQKWSETGRNVEVEHVLSAAVQYALASRVMVELGVASAPATVLLACMPGEQHSLPLDAIAAALAERRVASRILGASLPAEALVDAIRKLRPNAVFLWSQSVGTADVELLGELPKFRHRALVLVGGRGWSGRSGELAEDTPLAVDLSDAVTRILQYVAR